MVIVAILELFHGSANFLDVLDHPAIAGRFLQRPLEAFRDTIGRGLGDESDARGDAPAFVRVEESSAV